METSKVRAASPSWAATPPPAKKPRLDSPLASQAMQTDTKSSSVPEPKRKGKGKMSKRQRRKFAEPEDGTHDHVLWHDIRSLLGKDVVENAIEQQVELKSPVAFGDLFTVTVDELSSSGEALARLPSPHPPWALVFPFALPGEVVKIKVVRNARLHSYADLLDVVVPNAELRDASRIQCKYFGKCSGCQYQMLDYATQLDVKRKVVDKAYANYFPLAKSLVPAALPTIASPKEYAYRTKITPHFDAPPKDRTGWDVRIGFDEKGRRHVMDIEDCPIATPVLRTSLPRIRKEVVDKFDTYKRGATLLMRDSLSVQEDGSEVSTCIQDHKAIVRERVGEFLFKFPANSFFQNNNSILVPLTDYVRDAIFSPFTDSSIKPDHDPPTHLVDTYCGSGLFAITLSPHFEHVAGIEISEDSIRYAKHNVTINKIESSKCEFRAGQAEKIFEVVGDFPAPKTAMVIDPPRKGCDQAFITQLLMFGAQTVVYVSCNVHTQARDVGMILAGSVQGNDGVARKYRLESVRGFDLFPQTAHVESVAVLRLE